MLHRDLKRSTRRMLPNSLQLPTHIEQEIVDAAGLNQINGEVEGAAFGNSAQIQRKVVVGFADVTTAK